MFAWFAPLPLGSAREELTDISRYGEYACVRNSMWN